MELFYRQLGEGPPLIISHGLFGISDNWLNIGKHLSKHYSVYIIDNRNHGLSPHHLEWNYDVMAEDIKELLDKIGAHKAVIIGHSMGGKICMRFAEIYPERIERMIVVDISPRYYEPHHHAVLDALSAVNFDIIKTRKDAEHILRSFLNEEATIQFILKNIYWKEDGKLAFRFNYEVISKNIENVGEACFEFGICTVPTLFIRGDKSNYITNADIDDIYLKFTDVICISIENAGHWVHADKPIEFIKVVEEYLL